MSESRLILGDCLVELAALPDSSIDSLVTDPPYNLRFMGRTWDRFDGEGIDPTFLAWFSGFVDGEGCFSVHRKVVNDCQTFDCQFSLCLRADDRPILERIQRTLGIGTLSKDTAHRGAGNPKARYSVSAKAELLLLREVLQAFPLRAKKATDFAIWSQALDEWVRHQRGEWDEMARLRDVLMANRQFKSAGVRVDPFQMWCYRWGREALRVLKPGGFLLSFGGTRCSHRLAAGLEDAGFEIRDQILAWTYGSGFPKSLDVSKAIDKSLGSERERVAGHVSGGMASLNAANREQGYRGEAYYENGNEPLSNDAVTDEAKEWQGWGTALKPAHEPIIVARKPLGGVINVRDRVEHELHLRGVKGEIAWTIRRASAAAARRPTETSGSTAQPVTEGISARTASDFATRTTAQATERITVQRADAGAQRTPSTLEANADDATENFAHPSLPPTDLLADAAESIATSSSPSITSTVEGPRIGERTTEKSTPNSDGKDSHPDTGFFAGIATGLTGSLEHVLIRQSKDGAFEWPDDLPESVIVGSTVAANVLAHGTGGLNIDGCRIGSDAGWSYPNGPGGSEPHHMERGEPKGDGSEASEARGGRWPANVVLVHHEDCCVVGTQTLRGDQRETGDGTRPGGFADIGAENGDGEPNAAVYGPETVEVWECVEGCPVRTLDEQSGRLTSGRLEAHHIRHGAKGWSGPFADDNGGPAGRGEFGGDSGGASRFFYCAKVSRAERNAGLDGFVERESSSMSGRRDAGAMEQFKTDNDVTERFTTLRRNHHPTVKPIALMRWLVRLVTPPGGTILDPFLGSGTTGIAAALEGFSFVGIEREADYMKIAEARIAFWREHGEDGLRIVAERERGVAVREAREAAGQMNLLG